jgi:hypothetical protein
MTNRWLQRLGEIRRAEEEDKSISMEAVQIVQIVQIVQKDTLGCASCHDTTFSSTFEQFGQFEQAETYGLSERDPPPASLAEAYLWLRRGPPDGVDDARWRSALTDGDRFLETWGSQAADLGWTGDDLFGLHPTAPLARYDAMGLVWLLRGRTVERLTATEATIRASAGTTLSFRRVVS